MTIALDLGAFAMRSLRRRGEELVAHRCRSIAVSLADNAARRKHFQSSKTPFLAADGYLVVPGDAAIEAAAFFDLVARDLLADGEIPSEDPVSRQVISAVVEGLLPWSERPREICCYSQPGGLPLAAEPGQERRAQFVSQLVRLRGYEPLALDPATALCLSELGNARFTGIGLLLGASACDIAVVHRGVHLACDRIARGGRWIDLELARATKTCRRDALDEQVLDLENSRRRKEALNLIAPASDDGRIVADLYRNLVTDLLDALSQRLESHTAIRLLPQPMTIVCGGGPARIAGFRELLKDKLSGRKFPVVLAEPRFVSDQEYAVNRGCLIRAELEQLTLPTDGKSLRTAPVKTHATISVPHFVRALRRKADPSHKPNTVR